jgi:hypothetical protein
VEREEFGPFILNQARHGVSANQAYNAFHAAGGAMQRSTFLQAYAQSRLVLAAQVIEVTLPLDQIPFRHTALPFEVPNATGFMQYVDVYVLNRDTGQVEARPYGIRTDELLRRSDVIATALDKYRRATQTRPEDYPEQVLYALYTATYEFVPTSE